MTWEITRKTWAIARTVRVITRMTRVFFSVIAVVFEGMKKCESREFGRNLKQVKKILIPQSTQSKPLFHLKKLGGFYG